MEKYWCRITDMEKEHSIAKVVARRSLHDKDLAEIEFWQSQSPQERIAALEQIRSEYQQWRYGAQPRFERVYTIIKRK